MVVALQLKYCKIALNIAFQHFLLSVSGGKSTPSLVVVKIAEWLEPTTPDQCGQNPGCVINIQV